MDLKDGGRYYVRIDSQRPLVAEVLKERVVAAQTTVFSLGDVQPPAPPLTAFSRHLNNPNVVSLLGIVLILGLLVFMMSPMRSGIFKPARRPDTRFSDVIGVEEAKEALQDIVAYLKDGVKPVSNRVEDSEGPPDFWADAYTVEKIGPYPPAAFPTKNEVK